MAIYFPPVPPVQTGGAQPYGYKTLSQGAPEDNPPFMARGRCIAIVATIVALTQPDPWTYAYAGAVGGTQPYGQRRLPVSVTAVPEDSPPFQSKGRSAPVIASTVAITQPDPWIYGYVGQPGGVQPYQGKSLPAQLTRVGQDEPPYDQRKEQNRSAIVALTQPDPWQYSNMLGAVFARQAYGGLRQLNPTALAVQVDNPSFGQRRLSGISVAYTIPQPNPWVYTFHGGHQPYAPTPLDPIFEGLIEPIPGSGKKPKFPSYAPQPANETKPNKPFRPVWDKPRGGKVDQPKPAPSGPPPLPPAQLFGTPGHAGEMKRNAPNLILPDFKEFAPPDPIGIGKRLKSAQDESDAMAILRSLGLLPKDRG